jgi:tetratricopeptide (TPR) repeat protein
MAFSNLLALLFLAAAPPWHADMQKARDAQDRAQLERIATQATALADKQSGDADIQYGAALANSTLAEVAEEVRDKAQARAAADAGMKYAERSIALKGDVAEYHRLLGTLCGQAAGAVGGIGALKFGRCALDEVNKALSLDPKAPINYLSRGIGNYYLPAMLGGGVELAIRDFQKAVELDARMAEAHMWLGIGLRKSNRNAEARKSFEKAVSLNPARVWAKQQLEKTPAQ